MKSSTNIFIPPEWEKQSAVWVGWPTLPDEWGAAFHPARGEITIFVRALSTFTSVHIAAGSEEAAKSAETQCGSFATVHQIPLGDIWLRDTGPIIARRGHELAALMFQFDGWGGKYTMPGDTDTSRAIADSLDLPKLAHRFVLEGGAIELDGAGNLLTTRQCLLDGVRNPAWTEASAEQSLKAAFGVSRILWLDRGLLNDHTDGHIDNIARFAGPNHVICQRPSGDDDPHASVLKEIETQLVAHGLKVDTIPSPGRVIIDDRFAPASHLNFLITNNAVIVPVFENVYSGQAVLELASIFPDRQIVPLYAKNILSGGGTFHCMTREIPMRPNMETRS